MPIKRKQYSSKNVHRAFPKRQYACWESEGTVYGHVVFHNRVEDIVQSHFIPKGIRVGIYELKEEVIVSPTPSSKHIQSKRIQRERAKTKQ